MLNIVQITIRSYSYKAEDGKFSVTYDGNKLYENEGWFNVILFNFSE